MVKMSGVLDYMQLCRLCLVKDKVNVPIFGDATDVRQIFLKITACLPVKISQDDNLPKNICDSCLYKVDLLYQFYNTTANAEKQLIQWLDEIGVDVNIKSAGLPPQLSHAHPHSMKVDSLVKEERHEAGEGQHLENSAEYITSPQLYVGYNQQFAQANTSHENNGEHNNTPVKRTRGRPSSIKKDQTPATTTSTNKLDEDESMDEDSSDRGGMQDDSDDSMEETGGRIAKEEAESEEEYDVNAESLEPTTFVGVPNEAPCDADQPGPSGLNKPAVSSTDTGETDPLRVDLPNDVIQPKFSNRASTQTTDKHVCLHCSEEFPDKRKLSKHNRIHQKNVSPCESCGKIHGSTRGLNKIVKSFECEICNKKFEYKTRLTLHVRRHLKDYLITCKECGKGFYLNVEYKNHYDAEHKGIRYKCEHCDKLFKYINNLNDHMKVHESNYVKKLFSCDKCDKVYEIEKSLKKHIMYIHDNIPANMYICDICGKSVTSRASLEQHRRLHTGEKPYKCKFCGKAFSRIYGLKSHQRTHTNSKPYTCELCKKSFTQKSTLNVHMRYHSGERPFQCDICEKRFVTKTLMKYHKQTHGSSSSKIKVK